MRRRVCQLLNHDEKEIENICVNSNCNYPVRLLCIECHRQQLHNHGPCQQQQVLTLEKFRMKYGQSSEVLNINKRRADFIYLTKALEQIEQNIHECRDKATQYSQFLKNIQEQLKTLNQDVYSLSNEQLDNIIYSQQEPDFKIFSNTLQNIIKQTQEQVQFLEQMNQVYDEFQLQRQYDMSIILPEQSIDSQLSMNQNQDNRKIKILSQERLSVVSNLEYNQQEISYMESMKKSKIKIKESNQQLPKTINYIEIFSHQQDRIINSSAISQNEQYFAFVQDYLNLNVLNFHSSINFYKIFSNPISVIRFSEDSQHIFVGDSLGNVIQFRIISCIENILIPLYSSQIHEQPINNIIFLNQQQILTCSDDRSIIITDYKQQKQILKLENYHSGEIYGLDYDKIQDMIVSSSRDKSIMLYNKLHNKQLFVHQYAHIMDIVQVNFIKEGQYLLSSDCHQLKLWDINYQYDKIDQINLFQIYNEKNQIESTSKSQYKSYFTVSKEYKIYVIMVKLITILDLDFNNIQRIQTTFEDFKFIKRVNQPFSQLYIINQSDTQVQVLKKHTIQR